MGVLQKALRVLKDLQVAIGLVPVSGVILWNGRAADIQDVLWQLAFWVVPLGIWFGAVKPLIDASAVRRDRAREKWEGEWETHPRSASVGARGEKRRSRSS